MSTEPAWEVTKSMSVPQDHSTIVHERVCHVPLATIDHQSGVPYGGDEEDRALPHMNAGSLASDWPGRAIAPRLTHQRPIREGGRSTDVDNCSICDHDGR